MKQLRILSILFLFFLISSQYIFSQYIPYCEKGKWGFATTNGKIIISCEYDEVNFYSDDNLAKVKKTGKYGYINKQGAIVIPFDYDNCNRTYEVYREKHTIGIKRKPDIHLNYDLNTEDIKLNRYIVSKNNKFGILSLTEELPKMIVPIEYSNIQYDPNKKIFHCFDMTDTHYFNTNGEKLTQQQVNNIERIEEYSFSFDEDYGTSKKKIVIAKLNGKIGIIEQSKSRWGTVNDTIVPLIYDDIILEKQGEYDFSGPNLFGVKLDKKWGIIDRKKSILLPVQYDSIDIELSKERRHWAEYRRMFVVMKNGKWGIIGKKDDNVESYITHLPFKYTAISKLYYSYLLVQKKKKFQVFSIEDNNLINNKNYSSITKYENESVNGFDIFQATNKKGQTVYLGKNGVEFFND